MSDNLPSSVVERAFEVARSGAVATLEELISILIREGYHNVRNQINGPLIRKQLRDLMRTTKSA